MMKKEKLYEAFEDLGQRLGVKIITGKGDFTGGTCVLNDKKVIVVNKHKPIEQRLKVLATCFLDYNLEDFYVIPALRAFIEETRSLLL